MSNNLSRRQIIKAGVGLVTGTAAAGSVPLIANLIASSALVSPAQAQTDGFDGLVSVSLESGTIISLECLGDLPGSRYLDGRTEPINDDPRFRNPYNRTLKIRNS